MRAPAPSLRPTNGAPVTRREVHHLVDLLGEHLAERAAEDREVLREQEHLAAVDRAPPGDHTVGERAVVLDPEPVGAVAGEHVELVERARVEQQLDALAGGELAAAVLALDGLGRAGVERLLAPLVELVDPLFDRMGNWGRRCRAGGGFLCGHKAGHDTGAPSPLMALRLRGRRAVTASTSGQWARMPRWPASGHTVSWASGIRAA